MPTPESAHPSLLGPMTEGVPAKLRAPRARNTPRRQTRRGGERRAQRAVQFRPQARRDCPAPRPLRHRADEAKKVLSVALCDHFQHVRLSLGGSDAPFIRSRTCCCSARPAWARRTSSLGGRTHRRAVREGGRHQVSETGYVGGDVDDLVRDLVRRAGGNVSKAEHGILYLDEVDKLATREPGSGRDVSGRGVQTNLLKLMEDGDVPLISPNDVTGQLQSAMTAMRGGGRASRNDQHAAHPVHRSGPSPASETSVRRRLLSAGSSRGNEAPSSAPSQASLLTSAATAGGAAARRRTHRSRNSPHRISSPTAGAEFIGRLPVRVAATGWTPTHLFNVQRRSESSLIHQYERAFAAYGIRCEFRDDGLRRLAELAATEATGARGLMTVCERVFRDFKFRLPSSSVRQFAVTARLVDAPAWNSSGCWPASRGSSRRQEAPSFPPSRFPAFRFSE